MNPIENARKPNKKERARFAHALQAILSCEKWDDRSPYIDLQLKNDRSFSRVNGRWRPHRRESWVAIVILEMDGQHGKGEAKLYFRNRDDHHFSQETSIRLDKACTAAWEAGIRRMNVRFDCRLVSAHDALENAVEAQKWD
jgi:hypothetical protein